MKIAIISGINGQDASYLAELLLSKDYRVIGFTRRKATYDFNNLVDVIDHSNFILEYGSVTDSSFINRIIDKYKPDEYYNLAANSFVANSFDNPIEVMDINCMGCLYALEAIRQFSPKTKFYQASTSEMFGNVLETPQTENTPFNPQSPYGISKVAAHHFCKIYRESYGIFASCGILYNHEGPRRGIEFVTQKIIKAAVAIKHGSKKELSLGNLDILRDWGEAKEYVYGMWLMLQREQPDHFILATNKMYTVRYFCEETFQQLGLGKIKWRQNQDLKYFNKETFEVGLVKGEPIIVSIKKFFRPNDVNILCGNNLKAEKMLSWKPKIDLKQLIKIMIKAEEENYNE